VVRGVEPREVLDGIGVNVAAYRRAAAITQVELAVGIGRSVQWVSAVEQGRRHADRLSDLLRIATVVGCGVGDLIGRPLDSFAPRNAAC
jgi:transcriptional regulator with XRE-family HTH domain